MVRPPRSTLLLLIALVACGCAGSRALRGPAAGPTGTVRGTLSWQAEPVPCASAWIEGTRRRASSDHRGAFVLPGAPTGEHWLIVRSRVAPDQRLRVLVHEGEATFVHACLDAADRRAPPAVEDSSEGRLATFIGDVHDASGQRVPFANIFLPGPRLWTMCDGEGSFGMSGVPPGRWEARVEAPGRWAATEHIVTKAGRETWRNFVLPWDLPNGVEAPHRGPDRSDESHEPWSPLRPGVMLLPRLGDDCLPATDTLGAKIAAQGADKTGPAGRFALRVPYWAPWVVYSEYYCHPGDRLIRMSLVDAGGVVVWVIAPPEMSPDSAGHAWARQLSDEVTAPAGAYRVRFETSAGADSIPFCLRWMRVMPAPGVATSPAPSAIGTIVGTIRDPAGRPLGYANVILLGTRRGAQCDEQGHFRIERMPAGSYTLRVDTVGYRSIERKLDVEAGAVTHADVVVDAPMKVRSEDEIEVHIAR